MRYLTPNELGFSLDNGGSNEQDPNPQQIRQRAQQTQEKSFSATYTSRIGPNNSIIISKSKLLQLKFKFLYILNNKASFSSLKILRSIFRLFEEI